MAIVRFRTSEPRLPSFLWRPAAILLGLALLWVGSGHISIGGLLLMLSGLVLAVGAVAPPAFALPRHRREYPEVQLPSAAVRSFQ